jgi:hypothetical protein
MKNYDLGYYMAHEPWRAMECAAYVVHFCGYGLDFDDHWLMVCGGGEL